MFKMTVKLYNGISNGSFADDNTISTNNDNNGNIVYNGQILNNSASSIILSIDTFSENFPESKITLPASKYLEFQDLPMQSCKLIAGKNSDISYIFAGTIIDKDYHKTTKIKILSI